MVEVNSKNDVLYALLCYFFHAVVLLCYVFFGSFSFSANFSALEIKKLLINEVKLQPCNFISFLLRKIQKGGAF